MDRMKDSFEVGAVYYASFKTKILFIVARKCQAKVWSLFEANKDAIILLVQAAISEKSNLVLSYFSINS